jgi:hypothetical protein
MGGGFPVSAASKGGKTRLHAVSCLGSEGLVSLQQSRGADGRAADRLRGARRERCGLRLRFVEAAALPPRPRRTPSVASVRAAFDAVGVCVCHFFIVAADIRKGNGRRRKRCVLVRLLESMHIEGVPD